MNAPHCMCNTRKITSEQATKLYQPKKSSLLDRGGGGGGGSGDDNGGGVAKVVVADVG